jgi:hypothetical protein
MSPPQTSRPAPIPNPLRALAAGALSVLLTPAASGAPPPRYGGELKITALGAAPVIDPTQGEDLADATAALAVFERLYAPSPAGPPRPQLAAGPPETIEPGRVRIPIRPRVLRHDERLLDARAVAAWLRRLARPGHAAGHLVLPIDGGRARLEGRDVPLAVRAVEGRFVEIDLVFPYPHLDRLWARPEAALVLDGPEDRPLGTGPFAVDESAAERLVFFPYHRGGRPFVDAIALRGVASRFLVDAARDRDDAVVFGSRRAPCPGARSFVVLSAGRLETARAAIFHAHRHIDRRRIVERYLGPSARPVDSFFDGGQAPPPLARAPDFSPTTLIVSRSLPGGRDVAKRVQLDLVRADLPTTIERRAEDAARRLRRRRAPALVLERVVLRPGADPVDRFHALLALASRFGEPLAVPSGRLESFGRAPPELRSELVTALEAELRERLHIAVLARLPAGPVIGPDVQGARVGPDCAVDLAGAERAPSLP